MFVNTTEIEHLYSYILTYLPLTFFMHIYAYVYTYIYSTRTLIDLAIIVPYYTILGLHTTSVASTVCLSLRVFRILRLFTLLQNTFKRFENMSLVLSLTVYYSGSGMLAISFCTTIFLVFFASLVYTVEIGTYTVCVYNIHVYLCKNVFNTCIHVCMNNCMYSMCMYQVYDV